MLYAIYFIYGLCVMFYFMMSWLFYRKDKKLLSRLVAVMMFVIGLQCLKDLFFIKPFTEIDELDWMVITAADMIVVPLYVFVLIELCSPATLGRRKMTAKWKEKMEESAKALSGKPVEIAECNFNITEPLSLEFDDFFSKSDLKPKFNIKGTAVAKADTQTELNYVLKSIPVYLVGYDAEGKEVFKTKAGYVDVEDVNGKAFIKANTPVKFDPVRFGESDIEGSKTAKTYKLEVKE